MKMNKLVSIFIITAMLLSAMPMVLAPSTTITINPTYGYVGDELVVSGTLSTYNGHYSIWFDQDGDNVTDYYYGTWTATGYNYMQTIEVPPSFQGGRWVEVRDLDSTILPIVRDWYTVLTGVSISSDETQYVEGGPVTITASITGAPAVWDGTFDARIRVVSPSGATWNTTFTDQTFTNGTWTETATSGDPDAFFGEDGVYTAYLDWSQDGDPDDNLAAASTTFTVAILSQDEYARTETVEFQIWIPSTVTVDYYEIVKSDGVIIHVTTGSLSNTWYSNTYYLPKDAPLGTYTLRFHKTTDDGGIFKSDTFLVTPAVINVELLVLPFYQADLMRTESQLVNLTLRYAGDNSYVLAGDLGASPQLGVFYNTTQFSTLDLTGYALAPYPVWFGAYKFPKNAPVGWGWGFNVTSDTLIDRYGNKGPASYASTWGTYPITVHYAILKLDNWDDGNAPTLVHPPADTEIQRTLTATTRFRIIYPDTTLYTPSDLGTANVHAVYGEGGNYTVAISAADYNSTEGSWLAKWKIPYDAPVTTYAFQFWEDDVVDAYGNYILPTSESDHFEVVQATITVTDLMTNNPEYMSDDDLIVSFRALYPSGDPVINLYDEMDGIMVHFNDANGQDVGCVITKYNPSTQKYSGTWIVATGYASGTWEAEVETNAVQDDASPSNYGPSDDVTTNFNVIRLSLTDIWRYLHEMNATFIQCCTDAKNAILQVQTTANTAVAEAQAAKAAAEAASTAATAAKTAADEAKASAATAITSANAAKTAADAAKTAADGAGTKADAAKTAADAAKAAAQAATDANNSQTTLIYAAIGAALVAAIASIVALMQISRKIA